MAKPLASDFTVQYYEGPKYRPLSWVMNRLTYEWGAGSAVAFRTRNVAFHLANLILLYGIAMLLFQSRMVAATAALLLGVHPLVNQSVVGAAWTIEPCAFLLLSSLLLFLWSVRQKQRWFPLLALSRSAVDHARHRQTVVRRTSFGQCRTDSGLATDPPESAGQSYDPI